MKQPATHNLTPTERHDPLSPLLLRLPSVMKLTGLGRSTIYRLVAEQRFPSPVRLGQRAVGWRRDDLAAWSAALPSSRH
jgi:prophage regulatory protein